MGDEDAGRQPGNRSEHARRGSAGEVEKEPAAGGEVGARAVGRPSQRAYRMVAGSPTMRPERSPETSQCSGERALASMRTVKGEPSTWAARARGGAE
eukprot:7161171-Prymnesium_polylepis.1